MKGQGKPLWSALPFNFFTGCRPCQRPCFFCCALMSGAAVQYGQRRDLFWRWRRRAGRAARATPVRAAQRGRRVDARFGPQGKIIRQRDNAQLSGAGQRTAHQPGGKAPPGSAPGKRRLSSAGPGRRSCTRRQPWCCRVCRIHHAVYRMVMGQILAVSGAESKLQYLHAREPALRQQLIYAGKQLAQVLGHDGHIPSACFTARNSFMPGPLRHSPVWAVFAP